mmetsp:Transcript_26825/g.50100  ORF Transcript_26825/g.50100 Transcript_26825/m.50100 type:complete len:110 (-) Transcript_26825:468-797(-)
MLANNNLNVANCKEEDSGNDSKTEVGSHKSTNTCCELKTYGVSLNGDLLYKPMTHANGNSTPIYVKAKRARVYVSVDCDARVVDIEVFGSCSTKESCHIRNLIRLAKLK